MISAKAKSERGSAFILALMVVAAVGLLVVPVIYLATTGLRSTNVAQQRFLERYAAAAGVEEAIWIIQDSPPLPGAGVSFYTSTFNNKLTSIEIERVDYPPKMEQPDPLETVSNPGGKNVAVYTLVDPYRVDPCLSGSCGPTLFTYTLFFENFGGAEHKISRFGDCLPKGFQFVEEVGVVTNLFWGKDPIVLQDLIDAPKVLDTCEDGRQQVTWIFAKTLDDEAKGKLDLHPDPAIKELNVASIQFTATFKVEEEGWHYNRAWVELNSTDVVDTGETSPVIVEFSNFNISSTAGGTTVEARTTVYEYPGGNTESFIRSWQVE